MSAGQQVSVSALRTAVDRALADATKILKARRDLDCDQIDAPPAAPIDCDTAESADELNSPINSREGTPDSSGGSSSVPGSLNRHSSTSAQTPICGSWGSAASALSGNVGRTLICLKDFVSAAADLPSPHAAVRLLEWLRDRILPLLHGFANSSLAFSDHDVPAACKVAQQLVNAHVALLALDPPAAPRCHGERSVQILLYAYVCEYLQREGARLDDAFAVSTG